MQGHERDKSRTTMRRHYWHVSELVNNAMPPITQMASWYLQKVPHFVLERHCTQAQLADAECSLDEAESANILVDDGSGAMNSKPFLFYLQNKVRLA